MQLGKLNKEKDFSKDARLSSLSDENPSILHGMIVAQKYVLLSIGKVRLHRYICLWRASERKLGKKPVTKSKKTLEKSREQG
jgi:hypothetical protein